MWVEIPTPYYFTLFCIGPLASSNISWLSLPRWILVINNVILYFLSPYLDHDLFMICAMCHLVLLFCTNIATPPPFARFPVFSNCTITLYNKVQLWFQLCLLYTNYIWFLFQFLNSCPFAIKASCLPLTTIKKVQHILARSAYLHKNIFHCFPVKILLSGFKKFFNPFIPIHIVWYFFILLSAFPLKPS